MKKGQGKNSSVGDTDSRRNPDTVGVVSWNVAGVTASLLTVSC